MANPRNIEDEDNSEQREPDQAQAVADDALHPDDGPDPLDSEKPHGGITDDDGDVHDTLDMMKQMVTSGRVDMGAYAGEPLMDDGDAEMPGTPAGPMDGADDDMMGTAPEDMDEIADTGEDPLAAVVSDDDGDEEDAYDDEDEADEEQ
ncbi:MAG: hypothetical protein RIS17_542 [Pseudomonadota bacterium]|jgi:hypothetical protein